MAFAKIILSKLHTVTSDNEKIGKESQIIKLASSYAYEVYV
jgi:hypothetical protein